MHVKPYLVDEPALREPAAATATNLHGELATVVTTADLLASTG